MNYHLFALWILLSSTCASGLRLSNFASRITQLKSRDEPQLTQDQGPTFQEPAPLQSCYTGDQHAKLHELQRMECPTDCEQSRRPESVEIVMPFFQNDLAFTKLTAQSIAKHDKSHFISKVNLVWISPEDPGKFQDEIDAIEAVLNPTHHVQTHRYPIHKSGWHAQQMAKLDMASRANTEYAMILDVKNTFVRDFSSEDFFDKCGLAKHNLNGATGPERWGGSHPEGKWWSNAVKYLSRQNVEDAEQTKERLQTFIENEVVPFTVTPQLFHTETVHNLLSCDQEVSEDTIYNRETTEFLLYHAFQSLQLRGLIKGGKCVNSPESKNGQVFAVWREDDCSTLEKYLKQEADMPMFVGFHPGALKDIAQDKSTQCWSTLTQIYKQSGLEIDDKEWENQRRASECRGCEQTFEK